MKNEFWQQCSQESTYCLVALFLHSINAVNSVVCWHYSAGIVNMYIPFNDVDKKSPSAWRCSWSPPRSPPRWWRSGSRSCSRSPAQFNVLKSFTANSIQNCGSCFDWSGLQWFCLVLVLTPAHPGSWPSPCPPPPRSSQCGPPSPQLVRCPFFRQLFSPSQSSFYLFEISLVECFYFFSCYFTFVLF